jgi:hypothetical protein
MLGGLLLIISSLFLGCKEFRWYGILINFLGWFILFSI